MGKILQGPWKKTHQREHQDMFDAFIKLVYEFDCVLVSEADHLPKRADGHLDLAQIPITMLIQWAAVQAQKPMHEHGENGEITIRSGRDPGDGGPDSPSVV